MAARGTDASAGRPSSTRDRRVASTVTTPTTPAHHPDRPSKGPSSTDPMRRLHLYWPHLLLRLARMRWAIAESTSGSFPAGPLVLGGQPWADGTVLDADPPA